MVTGTLSLEYKLYIYTVVSESSSLQELVNSLLDNAVHEKLGISLISISINSKDFLSSVLSIIFNPIYV